MGFIKKLFGGNSLIKELTAAYDLEYKTHPHPMISGSGAPNAWLGKRSGIEFSLRSVGHYELIAGELFPYIDFVLARVKEGVKVRPLPKDLANAVTPLSGQLARRFAFTQIGHENSHYLGPQLEVPVIRDSLLRLSDAVERVTFYKRGVDLSLSRKSTTRTSFDEDLRRACQIAAGLQERHSIESLLSP